MQIKKSELEVIAKKVGISKHQIDALWSGLRMQSACKHSRFSLSSVIYYLGAMIVLLALSWFLGVSWTLFKVEVVFSIILVYMLGFIALGRFFWHRKKLKIPGGLFITLAVCLIPLSVYIFQAWMGLWLTDEREQYRHFFSVVQYGWLPMEIATIAGACIALKFFRFPFLTMPIFLSLWFMSMDITPWIFPNENSLFAGRVWVSIGFGVLLLIVAYVVDLKVREDFAFWGYLFGLATLCSGLSLLEYGSELTRFFSYLVYFGLLLVSVLFQRTVFLVFGAIGIFGYISHLFYRYFWDSVWFPLVLSLTGILVILIGLVCHKKSRRIHSFILSLLSHKALSWLPKLK